jgi:hypothetical protein
MTIVFIVALTGTLALWIVAFVFSKQRQRTSKAVVFWLGMFVVCPALAFASWAILAETATAGIDKPVGPGITYILLATTSATLLIWLGGWAAASFAGWIAQKRMT